jgi:hypothetical protein
LNIRTRFIERDIVFVWRGIMENIGFESGGVIDFDCRNIELKLSFRKDDRINREIWTVRKGFNGSTINTNVYSFTKI